MKTYQYLHRYFVKYHEYFQNIFEIFLHNLVSFLLKLNLIFKNVLYLDTGYGQLDYILREISIQELTKKEPIKPV